MPNRTFFTHVALPTGRLMYAPARDGERYVVVRRPGPDEVWIAPEGWGASSDAAGPFRAEDALRALRLAATSIPEGCERGPWIRGLDQFAPTRLPGHPNDWAVVDPTHLPPTVSRYHVVDIDGGGGEACCSPARHPPAVAWIDAPATVAADDPIAPAHLLALAREQHPELAATRVGRLARPWNAHPAGSAVLADRADLARGFVVVDLVAPT